MNVQVSVVPQGDQLVMVVQMGLISFTVPMPLEFAEQHLKAVGRVVDQLRKERDLTQLIIRGNGR